jgi:hypothetical protein
MCVGGHSALTLFQGKLWQGSRKCGSPAEVNDEMWKPGIMDGRTSKIVIEVISCPGFEEVPAGSPAQHGAITASVWQTVLPSHPIYRPAPMR